MGWSSRCPSIGSHRRLYLGGGVGVCGVFSDDDSSTGALILSFGVSLLLQSGGETWDRGHAQSILPCFHAF